MATASVPGQQARRRFGRRAWALVAVLVVGAIVVAALLLSAGSERPAGKPSGAGRSASTPATLPGGGAATSFQDTAAGFSLLYPHDWTRLPTSDAGVALLVASPNKSAALLVRTVPLKLAVKQVTLAQLPALRPLTDRLVHADRTVELVQEPAEFQINGLVGYAYAYTDRPTANGPLVGHVHYFVFNGSSLLTLVFQVNKPEQLHALSPLLARIASTLRATGTPAAHK